MLRRLRPAAGLTLVLAIMFQAPPALRLAAAPSGRLAETSPSPVATASRATPDDADRTALEQARLLLESVRSASYPELKGADIRVRLFSSDRDFFRTRFDVARFLSGLKMRFFVEVNPKAFELRAPKEGLRAIMAHELGHVFDFTRGARVRLLGLVRLASKGYTARFERWTDLQAISRGYAAGLIEYRRWLYRNVPAKQLAEKRRDYFSPEEIEAILSITRSRPEALGYWLKHVPRNLGEIQSYDAHARQRK
jgi:hypothetical protein